MLTLYYAPGACSMASTENVAILTYLARTGPLPACGERESTAADN